MKIAVYDIGTNSIHMLIVEVRHDLSYEVLGHEKDTTRLGDGSFENKLLTPEAMARGLDVLDRFRKIADKGGARRHVAVATSAVREAKNGGEFVTEIMKKTGLKVDVISGDEEGRLVYLAAIASIDTRGKKALVVDIGGGSMELALGNAAKTYLLESYKLGVTRMTEHFFKQDPPSKKELRRLESYVKQEIKKTVKKIRRTGYSMVIGTSGSMINLAAMVYTDRESKPLRLVNHYRFSLKDLEKVYKKIARMTQDERVKFPGLDPKRADIILAGLVLVVTLLKMLKADGLTVCDKNIREGIILDFIEKNKKRLRGEDENLSIRERSVLQLARRCSYDERHAGQVARLSLDIFDQTRKLHGLGAEKRELLKYASLLHDVGHYMSFKKHHKHSYYLIVNSDLDGFTSEEIETIGTIARCHRKSPDLKELGVRGKPSKTALKTLSSILRIADGLDRTHFSVVKSLKCRIGRKKIVFSVQPRPRQDTELELWAASGRADLFESVFKRKTEFSRIGDTRRKNA